MGMKEGMGRNGRYRDGDEAGFFDGDEADVCDGDEADFWQLNE
jgi:hypothetical protein